MTSAVLLQSGPDNEWWADSVECYCYLRNIQDLLSDGKTTYERRFGIPFNGQVISFRAMVEYHPYSAKDLSRLHQFGPKVLPGKFLGCALNAGGIWKGDIRIRTPRQKAQCERSANAHEMKKCGFPVADGTVKITGEDQDLRTSTFIRDRPERGEEQEVFRGE